MSIDAINNSANKNWIFFGISLLVTLFMLLFVNEWFWVGLPFTLTYFVKSLDVI